jgi:Fe-S-cluster containining protein
MTTACRPGCGACCIAPSIATPFPGMPNGKRAGERCVHLGDDARCALFGRPERPRFCAELRAEPAMCGASAAEAFAILTELEARTCP